MNTKNWFEVSTKGLKELQSGKPKHYIIRELVQNAFDEDIKECHVEVERYKNSTCISVSDDSPEGFKDLADAYTIFKSTSKRGNPKQRGRFNLGEKQAIALARYAKIETTKGTITFDSKGRHSSSKKREFGSKVSLEVGMTKAEHEECIEVTKRYLPPKGIKYSVNLFLIEYQKPYKVLETSLETELLMDDMVKKIQRKTKVHILYKRANKAYLYEMGIPVCEIDCKYDIDVQQKVPLSVDRETVSQRYLKVLFAEVLNETFDDIKENESSDNWVRQGISSKRITGEAVKGVVEKRFGDKVVIANPFDRNSIDEAIANGYKVVRGSELSKEEWENIRNTEAMRSSSEMFGTELVISERVEPDENMKKVAELTKKIAKKCLGIDIGIGFAKWEGDTGAQYGGRVMTFNVKNLGKKFFDPVVSSRVINLIIHELGHEKGMHTEASYHKALTQMAGDLVLKALDNPDFFKVS